MRQNPNFDNLDVIREYLERSTEFNRESVSNFLDSEYSGEPPEQLNYYLHFTNVQKVGLNPKQAKKYSTPIGIYSYPLNEYIWRQLVENKLPFAGDSTYVAVLRPTETKPLATFTDAGVQIGRNVAFLREDLCDDVVFNVWDACKSVGLGEAFGTWLKSSSVRNVRPHAAGRWWYATRVAAGLTLPGFVGSADANGEFDFKENAAALTAAWSKFLRDAGLAGVSDPGYGLIHPNEPTQTFFLRTSDVHVEVLLDNPWRIVQSSGDQRQAFEHARWQARKRPGALTEIPMHISATSVTGPLPPSTITTNAEWSTLTDLRFESDLHTDRCTLQSCEAKGYWSTFRKTDIIDSTLSGTFYTCDVRGSELALREAKNSEFSECVVGSLATMAEVDDVTVFRDCVFPDLRLALAGAACVDCEFHKTTLYGHGNFKGCTFRGVTFDGEPALSDFRNCTFVDCVERTDEGEIVQYKGP